MKLNYTHTIKSCFVSFGIQSLLINYTPLLFLTFQKEYQLSFTQITFLITINFIAQLITDIMAVGYVALFGEKKSIILAHMLVAGGFIGLVLFPYIFPSPYIGLLISTILYGIGGGLIEVLVNPVVEACPSDHKAATMTLLHSFFCWGHVFVVLISSAFFFVFGIENWRFLTLIWALVPLCNGLFFCFVPVIQTPLEHASSLKELASNKMFFVLLLTMICGGASEQIMAQWASTFAEVGLGVSKFIGDLAGPCLFAIGMGSARVLYSKYCLKIDLTKFIEFSAILCIISYALCAFINIPVIAFIGCMICGFSVGILWPGTLSLSAQRIPSGGHAMFACLALAGDIGCIVGPTITGFVFDFSGVLQHGFIVAMLFPFILCLAIWWSKNKASITS